MECYAAIKRKEILPFMTTWRELKGIVLSEISWRKTSTIMTPLIYRIQKETKMKKKTHSKLIDTENRGRWWWMREVKN